MSTSPISKGYITIALVYIAPDDNGCKVGFYIPLISPGFHVLLLCDTDATTEVSRRFFL